MNYSTKIADLGIIFLRRKYLIHWFQLLHPHNVANIFEPACISAFCIALRHQARFPEDLRNFLLYIFLTSSVFNSNQEAKDVVFKHVIMASAFFLGICSLPLGMEGGWIPDADITGTSSQDEEHSPIHARLYGDSSWIPNGNDSAPMIKVYLDRIES